MENINQIKFGQSATQTDIQHAMAEFLATGGKIKVLPEQPKAVRPSTNCDDWQTDEYLLEIANLCM